MPKASAQRWFIERIDHPKLSLLVANDEQGAVVGVALHAEPARMDRKADRLRQKGIEVEFSSHEGPASEAKRQLQAYLGGELSGFDLKLEPFGTPFEREAWDALLNIPFGETRSYGQQAQALGRPGAARAVGRANGINPIPILIPCHRVIGASGKLTGFGGGIDSKRWLLALESQQGELTLGAQPQAGL